MKNLIIITIIFFGAFFYFVSSAFALEPNDFYYSQQWYLPHIQAPAGWDYTTGAKEVVVAVIDSGVQIKHPDLYENIWVNQDEVAGNGIDDDKNGYIDDVNGWDFINQVPDPSPKLESLEDVFERPAGTHHGTIISGIIAAAGNNRQGVAGVAWQTKIMPLRVLNSSGNGTTTDVVTAIDYAVKNGAHIINMSFVGSEPDPDLAAAIERAYQAGVVVVAAAGNDLEEHGQGVNLDQTMMYPVCHDGTNNMVLGVAGADENDKKADFSNFGRNCVDLTAPGTKFFSTLVYAPLFLLDKHYGGYISGTSMSSAVVSGAAALAKSLLPALKGPEIRDLILENTTSIDSLNPNYSGKLGCGRLDLSKLLQAVSLKSSQIVSRAFSSAAIDRDILKANNFDQGAIIVKLRDSANQPLAGLAVTIISQRGEIDKIEPQIATTNQQGEAIFHLRSSIAGVAILQAKVGEITLSQTLMVTFQPAAIVNLKKGDLIKGSRAAVYYYGSDAKRHGFPNEKIFYSWFSDFSQVKKVGDDVLAAISLGSNATVRAGTYLVKISSIPKVYAVEPGAKLRWVESEKQAQKLYGRNWQKKVIDIPESFWLDYQEAGAITDEMHPAGALIRYANDLTTIYYIEAGKKRMIGNDLVFRQNLFQEKFVLTVPNSFIYPFGESITGKEDALVTIK